MACTYARGLNDGYHPKGFWEQRLRRNFSLAGAGCWRKGECFNRWMYKARERVLRRVLKKMRIDCQGKRILDIGCGTGFYVEFWHRMGAGAVMGIDITEKSVQEMTRRYPQYRFDVQDIGNSRVSSCLTFDIVGAFDVLFHIVEERRFEKAIANIRRYCHSATLIFISDTFGRVSTPPRRHCRVRSLNRYGDVLADNGMAILALYPQFFVLNSPWGIGNGFVRVLLYLLWELCTAPSGIEALGFLQGLALYVADACLLELFASSPSTKILIARVTG